MTKAHYAINWPVDAPIPRPGDWINYGVKRVEATQVVFHCRLEEGGDIDGVASIMVFVDEDLEETEAMLSARRKAWLGHE
jgi:hypothetical protein